MDHYGASFEFVNLDKFDGFNYASWVDNMKFLLISLDVFYVLDPNLTSIPQHPTGNKKVIADLEKRRVNLKKDEALCYKYIKNSLSDHLCDLFVLRSNNDPRLLWKALEMTFKGKEPKMNKDIIRKYLDFRIVDGKSIMEQVHQVQALVKTLKASNSVFPSEAFQIVAILEKLPLSWIVFVKGMTIRHDNVSLNDLLKQIQIEERARAKNKMDKKIVRSGKKTSAGDGHPSTTKLGVKPNINFKKTASVKLHSNRQPQHTGSGSNDLNVFDAELADLVANINLK